MEILQKDWIFSGPVDYEFKKYKLLSAGMKYQSMVRENRIYPVLSEIESHLESLYKFKYTIDENSSKLQKIKGIDLDTMSIEYENEHNEELEILKKIAEDATSFFEKIYKDVRGKWRELEKCMTITQIPDKKVVYSTGYVIVCTSSLQYFYSFNKPILKQDPKKFKIEFNFGPEEFSLESISNFVEKYRDNPKVMIVRADIKKDLPLEDAIVPILSFKLFNYLQTGG